MRPRLRFLDDPLRDRIVSEARDVLARIGLDVRDPAAASLLDDHGAEFDRSAGRVRIGPDLVDRALAAAPGRVPLFDLRGQPRCDLGGGRTHFVPGSSAIHLLDPETRRMRRPTTADYVRMVRLVEGLEHLDAQSTAFIPADVPEAVSDAYRLYLSLLHGTRPVVTGAFSADGFSLMRDLLAAARGGEEELRARPAAMFSVCPTAPLTWTPEATQVLCACARDGIPVEIVPMPLAGFVAPVTLVGTLVQHAAEALGGVVTAQCAARGAPVVWGCSAAAFDVRYETTPMGAAETMMLACAASEVGRLLGLPTQAYIALSDAKAVDAQAGLETGMGAALAVLAGIDSVSGAGMLDFENAQSLEKLVVDDAIAGMAQRLVRGVEARDDFPAAPRFEELLRDRHLLISPHTLAHLREEHHLPGPVVERASLARWREEGAVDLDERAGREVARLIAAAPPSPLDADARRELTRLMEAAARSRGLETLPGREP